MAGAVSKFRYQRAQRWPHMSVLASSKRCVGPRTNFEESYRLAAIAFAKEGGSTGGCGALVLLEEAEERFACERKNHISQAVNQSLNRGKGMEHPKKTSIDLDASIARKRTERKQDFPWFCPTCTAI